jgi:hypothetical protein
MMSLNMLIETPGGFDYSGADCTGWMKEAGFRETNTCSARTRWSLASSNDPAAGARLQHPK